MNDHFICQVDELGEGQCKSFSRHGEPYFVVRHCGTFYAYSNVCPHLGVELQWRDNAFLDSGGELIQCAMHGALFVIESGECVYGPCAGKKLRSHDLLEKDEALFLKPS